MESLKKVYDTIQKNGFKFFIFIIIGISIGIAATTKFYDYRIEESKKLGSFIHKSIIYDIKARQY